MGLGTGEVSHPRSRCSRGFFPLLCRVAWALSPGLPQSWRRGHRPRTTCSVPGRGAWGQPGKCCPPGGVASWLLSQRCPAEGPLLPHPLTLGLSQAARASLPLWIHPVLQRQRDRTDAQCEGSAWHPALMG